MLPQVAVPSMSSLSLLRLCSGHRSRHHRARLETSPEAGGVSGRCLSEPISAFPAAAYQDRYRRSRPLLIRHNECSLIDLGDPFIYAPVFEAKAAAGDTQLGGEDLVTGRRLLRAGFNKHKLSAPSWPPSSSKHATVEIDALLDGM